jgi:hypothetical protein
MGFAAAELVACEEAAVSRSENENLTEPAVAPPPAAPVLVALTDGEVLWFRSWTFEAWECVIKRVCTLHEG